MNNFDNLARLALNEGTLSDYMNAVRATKEKAKSVKVNPSNVAKGVAKGAIKGAAQIPGRAVQAAGLATKGLGKIGQLAGNVLKGAGAVYGALGGTQGAALINKVGGAVNSVGSAVTKTGSGIAKAGQSLAVIPQRINDDIKRYGQTFMFNQKHLSNYKKAAIDQYKDIDQTRLTQARNIDDVDKLIKASAPGISNSKISDFRYKFFVQSDDPKLQSVAGIHEPTQNSNVPQQALNTTPTVPVTKGTIQTKAGIPVKPPTKADVDSMNLPPHPLTSKSPVNRRR